MGFAIYISHAHSATDLYSIVVTESLTLFSMGIVGTKLNIIMIMIK